MYSLFYFDTEDSVSPPEAGNDDIVLWIADVLSEHGVRGSFHVIGDKARILEQRGRQDVIAAVRRHDASSHFNHGSVHPTTPELVAPADWDEGVRISLERERPGFADIERIFGRCGGLTRHGGSYAPQIVRAAGLCGKAFYGMPFYPPGYRAFWFAGTLCFALPGLIVSDQGGNGVGYFEPVYENDAAFEAQLERFDVALRETMRNWAFTSLFGSHPLRMNTTEYSCWNHYGGVNRTPPLPPPQRPAEQKAVIRKNFQRFVAYLAKAPGLKILGLSELRETFGRTPTRITAEHLLTYARRVNSVQDVPLDSHFSPAELLTALAAALVEHEATGALPREVAAAAVIGPTEPASDRMSEETWDRAAVTELSRQLLAQVARTGAIPSVLRCGGPAACLGLLAQAYESLAQGKRGGMWRCTRRPAYPSVAEAWRPLVAGMAKWRVFGPTYDNSRGIELTCAQAWSVKPAVAG